MALSTCLEVSEYSLNESAQATMLLSITTEYLLIQHYYPWPVRTTHAFTPNSR